MRRRPLMNSIVMTINLIIVFIICFVVFTLIGGFVSNKAFAFLAKNMSNTSSSAPTPYDYADTPHNDVDVNDDPFAEFGDSVSIDDNFLD